MEPMLHTEFIMGTGFFSLPLISLKLLSNKNMGMMTFKRMMDNMSTGS